MHKTVVYTLWAKFPRFGMALHAYDWLSGDTAISPSDDLAGVAIMSEDMATNEIWNCQDTASDERQEKIDQTAETTEDADEENWRTRRYAPTQ